MFRNGFGSSLFARAAQVMNGWTGWQPTCRDGARPHRQNRWKGEPVHPKTEPVFPKSGASQNPWQIFPKSVTDFPRVCGWFSQSLWQIFPKFVADFSQSLWQIFTKSVADFSQSLWRISKIPKIGDRFPQSRWLMSPKSVVDVPKVGDGFPKNWWQISQNRWLIFRKLVTIHGRSGFCYFSGRNRFFREMSITQQRLTAFPLHVHVR